MSLYLGPSGAERLGDILRRELQRPWTRVRFAVAYAKLSGIDHLFDVLSAFAVQPGRRITATVGIDQQGTSFEAIAALLTVFGAHGHRLFVCSNPRSQGPVGSPTFHPKLWLFDDGTTALLIVGSGNLTQGGLYSNYEVGTLRTLDLSDTTDRAIFDAASGALEAWQDVSRGDVSELSLTLLDSLWRANLVLSEDEIRRAERAAPRTRAAAVGRSPVRGTVLFGEAFAPPPTPPTRAPRHRPTIVEVPTGSPPTSPPATPILSVHRTFLIHLTPAAKTEVYLAKAPLDEDPAFFGLPFTGLTTPRGSSPPQPQANPWPIVDITVIDAAGNVHTVPNLSTKVWQYVNGPNANDDVRIYFNAEVQKHVVAGSVMEMMRDPHPGAEYRVRIVPPNHTDFAQLNSLCTRALPNSSRRYGWT